MLRGYSENPVDEDVFGFMFDLDSSFKANESITLRRSAPRADSSQAADYAAASEASPSTTDAGSPTEPSVANDLYSGLMADQSDLSSFPQVL